MTGDPRAMVGPVPGAGLAHAKKVLAEAKARLAEREHPPDLDDPDPDEENPDE